MVTAIALGPIAGSLEREALGAQLDLSGFLAPRREGRVTGLALTGYRRASQ